MVNIIIIGGDAAGMSAAMEIVRNNKSAKITVLEKGGIYSYGQCGLPYVIDGRVEDTEQLIARPVEVFREKYGIDARVFHDVQHIDGEKQLITGIHTKTGEQFELHYDQCLVATGASSIMPPFENVHLRGIHTIKTIPQMEALLTDLAHAKKAVVIGAGFIGLEAAEALKLRGLDVTILQRDNTIMKHLVQSFSEKIEAQAAKHGVQLKLQQNVIGFEGEERVTAVRTATETFEADVVIVATGIKPNTDMIEAEKLSNGALIVNEKLQTSVPNIYAAGDCATHYNRIKKVHDYIPLGTTANKQGRIVGRQLSGKNMTFAGVVGTMIFKFFDLTVGFTGIETPHQYKLTANHIAGYYPTPKPIDIVMFTTEDGKLQGLQAIGEEGVDKRIDVFATALYNDMTLEQLAHLDLSYAPPYNGVWDPLQQVAKRYT